MMGSLLFASAIISLTIPAIDIWGEEVHPCPNWSLRGLQNCVDKYELTADTKYPIILGHNDRTLAKVYDEDGKVKLKRGDKIIYNRVHYKITSVRVVDPTDTWILERKYDLLLQTCFPSDSDKQRIMFLAKKI